MESMKFPARFVGSTPAMEENGHHSRKQLGCQCIWFQIMVDHGPVAAMSRHGYESSNLTVHKPGIYKGAKDPLLAANQEERASSLSERFKLGQRFFE